jgi:hypothetical protein
MRRRRLLVLALTVAASGIATVAAHRRFGARAASAGPLPGTPAPAGVLAEIQQELDDAVRRFRAKDAPGVLAHVSEQYRTGQITKRVLANNLQGIFSLHDDVKANVRLDTVRLVGEHAWIYSSGDVSGRVRMVGTSLPVLTWKRELEIARRENGRWRLYGYQQ